MGNTDVSENTLLDYLDLASNLCLLSKSIKLVPSCATVYMAFILHTGIHFTPVGHISDSVATRSVTSSANNVIDLNKRLKLTWTDKPAGH